MIATRRPDDVSGALSGGAKGGGRKGKLPSFFSDEIGDRSMEGYQLLYVIANRPVDGQAHTSKLKAPSEREGGDRLRPSHCWPGKMVSFSFWFFLE
jgi:hypothetical protein